MPAGAFWQTGQRDVDNVIRRHYSPEDKDFGTGDAAAVSVRLHLGTRVPDPIHSVVPVKPWCRLLAADQLGQVVSFLLVRTVQDRWC